MMSVQVPITVEHPQYTQTFVVCVPPAGTVNDIKQEIARACPGNPRVDGQRLISKGRILDDGEKIETLWAGPEDVRVVHLAVSPHSWPSIPPEVSIPRDPPSNVFPEYRDYLNQRMERSRASLNDIPTTPPPTLPPFETLPFISYIHHKALRALSPSTPAAAPGADGSDSAREYAKSALQASNYSWPAIFDVEFPLPSDGGVAYEFTLVSGRPFLQNLAPYATATARQQHALNVLSQTFPLLTLVPARRTLLSQTPVGPLQQTNAAYDMNAGAPRPDANGRPVIAVRVNMRDLVTPLILLFIRTLILLYFFSPARKPVFGILLGAYILYEAWGAVRGAVFDVGPLNGNNGAAPLNEVRRRAEPANGAGAPAPGAGPAALFAHQNPGASAAANLNAGIERLAQMSLDTESRWLENGASEPGILYKITTFAFLLVLSIHPGFWNRRRAALRAREGLLRTEANALERAMDQPAEGEETSDERARQARQQLIDRQARRPAWIKEYIERVRSGDWIDE